MIIRMCAFTGKGMEIVKKIEDLMPKHLVEIREPSCDLQEWTRECFRMKVHIVFVGAAGIAVRNGESDVEIVKAIVESEDESDENN